MCRFFYLMPPYNTHTHKLQPVYVHVCHQSIKSKTVCPSSKTLPLYTKIPLCRTKRSVSHWILPFPCKFTLNKILELLNICFLFFCLLFHFMDISSDCKGNGQKKKSAATSILSLCLSGYFWCKCLKCSLGECKSAFVFSWCIRLRYSLTGTFLVHAPAHKHTKVCHALIPKNMQLSE